MKTIPQLKVCGLKNNAASKAIAQLDAVDFIGFIFFEHSPRFTMETVSSFGKQRVGVFVNASLSFIEQTVQRHQLNAVQLHGDESPEFCRQLPAHLLIIKAFGISEATDFEQVNAYHDVVDYFLFDTKSDERGGSGNSFPWELTSHYNGPKHFFLSGGIGLHSLRALRLYHHPLCIGIDLNSCFEDAPGIKNTAILHTFIQQLTYENNIVS